MTNYFFQCGYSRQLSAIITLGNNFVTSVRFFDEALLKTGSSEHASVAHFVEFFLFCFVFFSMSYKDFSVKSKLILTVSNREIITLDFTV